MSEGYDVLSDLILCNSATTKGDKELSNFICGYLVVQAIHNLLALTNNIGSVWQVASKGILALLLLISLYRILLRSLIKAISSELLFAVLLLISYLFCDINDDFGSLSFNLLFAYLPMGIACYAIYDYEILLQKLYRSSFIIEFVTLLSFIIAKLDTYSMTSGFLLLLPILLHIDNFIKEKRLVDGILPIIDIAFIVAYASRGPIVCIGVYILMYVVFESSVSRRKKTIFIIVVSVLVITVYFNLDILAALFSRITGAQSGISRTIRLLQTNQIGYDADRFPVFKYYIDIIRESPFVGKGLAASWNYSSYPHNIFIEFCLAFGVPIGIFLSIMLVLSWYRGIRQTDSTLRRLAQVFVAGNISILWSGSFLMSPTFFVCLALCMKGTKRNRLRIYGSSLETVGSE